MPPPSHLIQQLTTLGISKAKASFALSEHNNDVEASCEWCFEEVPLPCRFRSPSQTDPLTPYPPPLLFPHPHPPQGAKWTPQDLLGTTFARPPQAYDEPDSSSIPHRTDAPRGSPAGGRVPPWRALEPGTKVHIGKSRAKETHSPKRSKSNALTVVVGVCSAQGGPRDGPDGGRRGAGPAHQGGPPAGRESEVEGRASGQGRAISLTKEVLGYETWFKASSHAAWRWYRGAEARKQPSGVARTAGRKRQVRSSADLDSLSDACPTH